MTILISVSIESDKAVDMHDAVDAIAEYLWGVELSVDDDDNTFTVLSVDGTPNVNW